MKKHFLYSLMVVLLSAATMGMRTSLPAGSETRQVANSYTDTRLEHPHTAIEYTASVISVGHTGHCYHSIPFFLSTSFYTAILHPAVGIATVADHTELFGNDHLAYNYPSHNFW